MQTLKFFGNGSGFTDSHTNAYFIKGKSLVLIDLSMLNLYKVLALNPEKYSKVFIFVTHMHDDHVSGIGMFLQHMYYRFQKTVFIVAPFEVCSALQTEFTLKGLDSNCFVFKEPNKIKSLGIEAVAIKTKHAPELEGQCFGYIFYIDGKKIVYSGDTNNLNDFLSFIKGKNIEFYLDVSVEYGRVHILFDDVKEKLEELAKDNEVFLMHIDNMEKMKQLLEGTDIQIAKIGN